MRPGVEIVFLGPILGQQQDRVAGCTANFIFTSPDNDSLFIGTAAHCVEGEPLGAEVVIAKGAARGTLFYSSFLAMNDAGETDAALLAENDFALVRIAEEDRGLVHPAVRHFGGPTGTADPMTLAAGDVLFMYGATDLRPRLASADRHAGCVGESNERITRASWLMPAMGGDSGSPVLTATGEALGVHRGTFYGTGDKGLHEATNLAFALAYARDTASVDVRLAEWPLLSTETLAAAPCAPSA